MEGAELLQSSNKPAWRFLMQKPQTTLNISTFSWGTLAYFFQPDYLLLTNSHYMANLGLHLSLKTPSSRSIPSQKEKASRLSESYYQDDDYGY